MSTSIRRIRKTFSRYIFSNQKSKHFAYVLRFNWWSEHYSNFNFNNWENSNDVNCFWKVSNVYFLCGKSIQIRIIKQPLVDHVKLLFFYRLQFINKVVVFMKIEIDLCSLNIPCNLIVKIEIWVGHSIIWSTENRFLRSHVKAQISIDTIRNIAIQKINGKMLQIIQRCVWYIFHTGRRLNFSLVRLHEFSPHVSYLSHIIEQTANRYTNTYMYYVQG